MGWVPVVEGCSPSSRRNSDVELVIVVEKSPQGGSEALSAWQLVRAVLARAMELPEHERSDFLDRECAGRLDLRREVESLLAAHERAETTFLSGPRGWAEGEDDLTEGSWLGPYQLRERIGEGGMGIVYRAVRADDAYRREVAVKWIKPMWGAARNRRALPH